MKIKYFLLVATVLLTSCGASLMTIAPQQEMQKVESNESQVVFLRSAFVGSAIGASLYDVTDGNIKFIGMISNGTKVSYKVKAGKYRFMVVSEAADFMEADLTAGKTYYSLVTPRMGAWKARFSLWPIKNNPDADYSSESKAFDDWKKDTKLVVNSDKSFAWYESNKASVQKKHNKYLESWKNKSEEDLLRRTLLPEDGV